VPTLFCHLLLYFSTRLRTYLLSPFLQGLPGSFASPSNSEVMNLANSAPPTVSLTARIYNIVDPYLLSNPVRQTTTKSIPPTRKEISEIS
jgi:hypothetical protein